MKRKVKITFEVICEYPYLEKETKKLSKDFDNWLKEWSGKNSAGQDIVPLLYLDCEEHTAHALIKVKIVRDKEKIQQKSWNKFAKDL